MAPMLQHQVKQIIIQNRSQHNADALAKTFHSIGHVVAVKHFSKPVDLVINGTSVNCTVDDLALNTKWLTPETLCYDINYTHESNFLQWANQHKVAHKNGLGMLIEQAAQSFYFWFGVMPETQIAI